MAKKIHPDIEKVLAGLYSSPVIKDMEKVDGITKEDADASRQFLKYIAEQMSEVLFLAQQNATSLEDWEKISRTKPTSKKEEGE